MFMPSLVSALHWPPSGPFLTALTTWDGNQWVPRSHAQESQSQNFDLFVVAVLTCPYHDADPMLTDLC